MYASTTARGLTYFFQGDDAAVGRCLQQAGEFSRTESDYIRDCLAFFDGSRCLIDVGANIGAVSLPVARALPDVQVICIEAHLPTYQALCATIATNGLSNVRAMPWCVGKESGTVQFPLIYDKPDRNYGGVSLVSPAPQTVPTVSIRLDEFVVPDVRFLKIDTEGADYRVLQGARILLATQSPFVLFERIADDGGHVAAVQMLRDLGYRCHWLFSPFVLADNEKGWPVNIAAWTGDANIAAIPPGHDCPWGWPEIGDAAENWKSHVPAFARILVPRYAR